MDLKVGGLLLALAIASPASTSLAQQQFSQQLQTKLSEHYSLDNIVLTDLASASFRKVSSKSIPLTSDLARKLKWERSLYDIKDPGKFEALVLKTASELGIEKEVIGYASALELLDLTVGIVCKRMNYFEVDDDTEFKAKYGENLPLDVYFELGLGDCDKYTALAIRVFDVLKKYNSSAVNIHLGSDNFVGCNDVHAWNVVILVLPDRVELVNIDITHYDQGTDLETDRIYYNFNYSRAFFFSYLGDYSLAAKLFEDEMPKHKEDSSERSKLYHQRMICELLAHDYEKVLATKSLFEQEGLTEGHDSILHMTYTSLVDLRRLTEAGLVRDLILKKYPNSIWAEEFRK